MPKQIGILTSGGDCPGLNAAIRGVGKSANDVFHMELVGFRDGFRGLVHDRILRLESSMLSGILTSGGTILGTSRDKPHQMPIGNEIRDMTGAILDTYHRNHLDALICIGGGGTQKNALRLKQAGLNVVTLPKTIDNDIAGTDVSIGFDTALGIATEAIDRLHSTATSHNRIIVVEVMGHRAGWLALGAGIAGGADVILIPEIPYDAERVAEAICNRARAGKRFSIVVMAEGAMSGHDAKAVDEMIAQKQAAESKSDKKKATQRLEDFHKNHLEHTVRLTERLEKMTGQESRMTILGHLQRGGTPSPADRVLATRLGTACAEWLDQNTGGVMLAARGECIEPVPLEDVAGKKKFVPIDHPWVRAARLAGVSFGN